MKKSKLVALFTLIALMFVGCGKKKAEVAQEDKNIKIMAVLMGTEVPTTDSTIFKKMEELTGYKLDIQWVPDNMYNDKVSITLASSDVPHIMTLKDRDATVFSNIQNGAFWEIGTYLSEYDNLSKMNPNIKINSSFNGKTYGIYRERDLIRNAVIIRKDWLDKLGLKEPTNLEEFKEVLRQFTEKDPDGNGKNDTYGLAVPKWPGPMNTNSPFDQMAVWFGSPNVAKYENGEIIPDFTTQEYMESLKFFKEIYKNKYMNQDFATMDSKTWNEPFINGKAGVIIDTQSRAMQLQREMLKKYGDDGKNGDSYVTMIGNVKVGNKDLILPSPGFAGILAMPKQGVKDEKELKKVLDFLNKLNTKEAVNLLTIGVEGTHYTMENGVFTPTTDKKLLDELLSFSQLGMNVTGQEKLRVDRGTNLEAQRKQIWVEAPDKAVFNPIAPFTTKTLAMKGAQLQNIMSDARIQYIAGQIDEAGYKAAVDLWMTTGGKNYLEELKEYSNMIEQ